MIEEVMKLAKEHHSHHFVIAVWRTKEAESPDGALEILEVLSASIALADDIRRIWRWHPQSPI